MSRIKATYVAPHAGVWIETPEKFGKAKMIVKQNSFTAAPYARSAVKGAVMLSPKLAEVLSDSI